MKADAVLLPKVAAPADLDALAQITGHLPIWAMMETPRGMLNARLSQRILNLRAW